MYIYRSFGKTTSQVENRGFSGEAILDLQTRLLEKFWSKKETLPMIYTLDRDLRERILSEEYIQNLCEYSDLKFKISCCDTVLKTRRKLAVITRNMSFLLQTKGNIEQTIFQLLFNDNLGWLQWDRMNHHNYVSDLQYTYGMNKKKHWFCTDIWSLFLSIISNWQSALLLQHKNTKL